ncbi:histidine kinase [Novosphingobium sp. AAP1]|uniref:FecR family protein n=1 Tax=Novosphingobium sp. AAP1 TaxID=1523413 RepID=UPI0006B8AE52|nr:FecR domain-containing protein [Novosphingobium sp. AAP1]KPF53235.1 histidine kinase [Novosphingobium sp. AAP1]
MTDASDPIPRRIHDAAGDWLLRRQQHGSPEVERAFAAWIAADHRHQIAYVQIEQQWRDSERLAASAVGQTRKLIRAPFLMRHSTHVAAASLGVVVLLGVGTASWVRYGAPFALISPAQAATYETALGEIRTVSLPDGSQLTLDTATRVRVTLSAHERRISLEQGRVRFRVAPDSRRPFTVAVPGGAVATGSKLFDVSLASGRPVVTVLEGQVILPHSADDASRPGRPLAAGQSLDLTDPARPHAVPAGETQWTSGMLALDGTPLGDAVAAINRYNRRQLRLAEPDLGRLSITGAFQVRDPEAFAQAVAATFTLGIDRSDPGIIVLRPPQ